MRFTPEHARVLGLDLTSGTLERVRTMGGPAEIYLFDLEIEIVEAARTIAGQGGFFASHHSRNILGRSVIFSALEVGFRERAQLLNLRPED